MSFDDYARHMAQKYRLAISIALLNIKPKDLSIDQFLDEIKNTINEKNAKDNSDDLNISACSDDFNIDSSDEINSNQNCMNQASHDIYNDPNYIHQNRLTHSNLISENDHTNKIIEESQVNSARKDEGIVVDDSSQFNDKGIKGNANTTQVSKDLESNSNNILNNLIVSDVNKQRKEKFRELIKVLKGNDVVASDKVENDNQQIFHDITKTFDPMDTDSTQCYDYEITDNIDLFNNFDKDFELNRRNQLECKENKPIEKDYTQTTKENTEGVRKRLNDNELCDRELKITKNTHYITENTKEIIITSKNNENDGNIYDLSNYQNSNLRNINNNKKDVSEPKIAENVIEMNIVETTENKTSDVNLKSATHKVQNQIDPIFIDIDTQETMIYTDTQMNTHYSPSQMNHVIIDKQFIYGNKHIENSNKNVSNTELNSHNYRKENKTDENKENSKYFVQYDIQQNQYTKDESYQNFIKKDAVFQDNPHKNKERNIIENDTALSQNMDINTFKAFPDSNAVLENCAIFDKSINKDDTCAVLTNTEESCTVFDKTIDRNNDDIDTDLTDGEEKIPFKIIEEINRIKIYLRRKENKDVSSGYRSSQTKSSLGGTPQNLWIGQSASNIFNYLSNCCLATSTQHLIEQISEMLGQLIDRLHEEETYPAFLEEMLTTVDNTLQLLYEEESYVFDVLLKKDEQIQRILLLNKSTHVQKFTIVKINNILQKLLDDLSADDTTNEIQNINKIENLCYIFQILQILLPKYSANSQNSQNSQDERVLRKKDITDIWRKKWIDEKIEANAGSFEDKCVLRECSAILNKIIISFMDGYSLIAYSALKCFNIMQS